MSGVNKLRATKIKREGVIERLTAQLKTGTKNTKNGAVELTDGDKGRINKELETLSKRV